MLDPSPLSCFPGAIDDQSSSCKGFNTKLNMKDKVIYKKQEDM